MKKGSSKWMKTKGESLGGFQWQSGYAAFSVSQSNLEQVRSYIANQKAHHQRMEFTEELRSLLVKHGIKFDERYVWD